MATHVKASSIKFSLDELWKKKCLELKEILRANGQSTSGTKQILVARCYALNTVEEKSIDAVNIENTRTEVASFNPLEQLDISTKIGYNEINLTAKGRQWQKDLRLFPPCNFHQLYEYLVVRTRKFEDDVMRGVSYKQMRSYKFFQEGHIKQYEIARGFGNVWVKAKVIASMKHELYRVILVCKENGDILYGACECPAGLGIKGAGKCNHLGGVLFAITDFHEKGLHQKTKRVSCTSKLNGWIVPRNLTVKPKPLKDIKVKKIQFGKKTRDERPTVNTYDPRAPQDTTVDTYALHKLYDNLQEHAPNSGFFYYHDPPAMCDEPDFVDNMDSENVAFNTTVVTTCTTLSSWSKTDSHVLSQPCIPITFVEKNNQIQDTVPIDQTFINKYVEEIVANEKITDDEIRQIEIQTKGQADNILWKKIHKYKATASNFGKIVKCSKNPDGLLNNMFYSEPYTPAILYGKQHEQDAIEAYKNYKISKGSNIEIKSVGLILSKNRPGLGASLDGIVIDNSADIKKGGLEVKCPFSKANMDLVDACKDGKFFLKSNGDNYTLNRNNNYYFQIQGQMYVANLKWTDFVVWFGPEKEIFVERIFFEEQKWNEWLPKIDLFYKWAIVPELLTRRIERKLPLLDAETWKSLIK